MKIYYPQISKYFSFSSKYNDDDIELDAKRIKSPRRVILIGCFDHQNQRDKIAEDKSSGLGFPRFYERPKANEIQLL